MTENKPQQNGGQTESKESPQSATSCEPDMICSEENRMGVQLAVGAGSITIAIIVFFFQLKISPSNFIDQIVLALLGITSVALFTSSTFYLKGANPYGDSFPENPSKVVLRAKSLNIQGDVFYIIGLYSLMDVSPLLFSFNKFYLACGLTTAFLILAWAWLFREGVGILSWRLLYFSFVGTLKATNGDISKAMIAAAKLARDDGKFDNIFKGIIFVILGVVTILSFYLFFKSFIFKL